MPSNYNRDAAKAWLKQRLSNGQFASEWKSLLHASIESFIDYPISELISKDDLHQIVSESLTRRHERDSTRVGITTFSSSHR